MCADECKWSREYLKNIKDTVSLERKYFQEHWRFVVKKCCRDACCGIQSIPNTFTCMRLNRQKSNRCRTTCVCLPLVDWYDMIGAIYMFCIASDVFDLMTTCSNYHLNESLRWFYAYILSTPFFLVNRRYHVSLKRRFKKSACDDIFSSHTQHTWRSR